jgi:outer membrane protein
MRYLAAIAAIGFVALLAPTAALGTEAAKIGIVDMKRVYEESKYRTEHEQRVEELSRQKQAVWNQLKADFDRHVEEARKEMLLLTEEAKAAKQAELAAEARRLQEFEREAQRAIAEQSREYLKTLEDKVGAIVEALAAEQGLDLVLNRGAVIYNKNVTDLTDAVLEKLNAMYDEEHAEASSDEGE